MYYWGSFPPILLMDSLRGCRIQVVGHAGAGKSTFARELAETLHVPVVRLDLIFWSDAWVATPQEEAREAVRKHAEQEEWVIDGNQWVPLKDITYPRATDILWIDPPFHIWLYRLLSRALRKAFSEPGSFYKDFLNPRTSVILLAFRLRKKKTLNWTRMLSHDSRWKRVEDTKLFLKGVKRTLTQE